MLTKSCLCVFGDAFLVLHFYCNILKPYSLNVYRQTFNTITELAGAHILMLKVTKSK